MAKIISIIKYEGDNSTFIWKHPQEDFNTGTQLIVHESQEAIFFLNGQALDLFGPGRHTLETQNIPLVGKFLNRATNDETPFHCEVYFVNKTEQMAIKWGTDSKVEYIDRTYNFPLNIGASGEMNLACSDSRKLLVKLVGTDTEITQMGLIQKFRAVLMTKVKSYLANSMREQNINIFSIDERLIEISEALNKLLQPDFNEYGINLVRFFVTRILKPEEDKIYQKFKELHFRQYADVAEAQLQQKIGLIDQQTIAQRMVIESQGIAQKRATEGYSYQEERRFDVSEKVAENEGVGEFSNMGIGLGMISGVGGTIGNVVGGIMNDSIAGNSKSIIPCSNCGINLPENSKFCLNCGEKVIVANSNIIKCPKCSTMTQNGKFCMNCGGKLTDVCPSCGINVEHDGIFCHECGQKLKEKK